ncbi:MAG: hypothetical protein QOJ34_2778, partial [Pseudonocardiales bacterium]|nr:hypothetical protein [Pseudonocardiales bacterium]
MSIPRAVPQPSEPPVSIGTPTQSREHDVPDIVPLKVQA